jgi:hypothetical protein
VSSRPLLLTLLLSFSGRAHAAEPATAPAGLQADVVFADYSPLSQATELMRRLLSPLQVLRTNAAIAHSGRGVNEQSIDLAREKFAIYVPPSMPPDGYALLVFIPPWEQAIVPASWTAVLDRHGIIFVTAAHSGNDTSLLDRREPLALLAAHNIVQRYPIDPARAYVGGFSGGSRVALRLALAYPDLFRGALLNAGSDPIGTGQIPLPPAKLMHKFQESTRLVYLTGNDDAPRLDMDMHSRTSMQNWCVFDVKSLLVAWSGHEVPNATVFNRGLSALEEHESPAPEKLDACRCRYEQELDAQLQEVGNLLTSGKIDAARTLLDKIDARYGGLAAPRSIGFAQTLESRR